MGVPNFENRSLYHGDNLDFLRGMNSETVHLIATDPPFNKNRDFHATPDSLASGARFKDRWRWDKDVHEEWTDSIIDDFPAVWEVITAARAAYGDDMGAFLCWLGVRLMEMRRVLRPDGSIYLHIDHTAHAYVKCMMDAIFGWKNFRNEIVWKRMSGTKSTAKRFFVQHDSILYYAKSSKDCIWNRMLRPLTEEEIEASWFRYTDHGGRRYKVNDLTSPSKHSGYEYEFLGAIRRWRYPRERMEKLLTDGHIHHKSCTPGAGNNVAVRKRYLDEMEGKPFGTLWVDIQPLNRNNLERTGYPTQKPLALYRRIIEASSNPGDVVLDPFAGCATTPVAAEQLGRQWVGMDIWDGAKDIVLSRLEDEWLFTEAAAEKKMFPHVVHIKTEPSVRTDDNDVAASALRLKIQRPQAPWQKISHKVMTSVLAAAQQTLLGVVCAGCGRELEREFMQLDHILPKAEGGENHILNRILLCGPCNRRKRNYLTLAGLRRENKKKAVGWMKDENAAKRAQDKAREKAEWLRDHFGSPEVQALIGGQL